MKKHLFTALCSVAAAFSVAAAETPQKLDPHFEAVIKHVDVGGEFLFYQNVTSLMKICDNMVSYVGQMASQNDPSIRSAFDIAAKLLDLTSLKAQAASSAKLDRRFYVFKQFMLVDPNTKSVLSAKAFPNAPLESMMRSLPADTRIAVCSNVNSAYIWARINEEIIASGDKGLIAGLANFKAKALKRGVNVDALAASTCGPMLLVVSGKTPVELKIAVAIADKDGALSAQLRKSFAPKAGESFYPIKDLNIFPNARLVYSDGCVLIVSDPKILEKPVKMFGDVPRHAKFLAQLPKEGNSFVIVDIPPKFAEFINAMTPMEYRQMFRLKALAFAAVGTAYPDGMGSVAVSNFSLPMAYPRVVNAVMANAVKEIVEKSAAQAQAPAPAPAPAKTAK